MPGGEPPSRGFSGVGHRQVVACALATLTGELIAWHLLPPRLQQQVADDVLAVPNAIQSAAATTGGLMLAGLGAALLACTLYNRLAREPARRREGAARNRLSDLPRPCCAWSTSLIRSPEPRLIP